MIEIQGGNESSLLKLDSGAITGTDKPLTVGQLELGLLSRFPIHDAEDWDRTGLLAGDPASLVTGVAVALDVTADAISAAEELGCNVLLTHHPAFLEPPESFIPTRPMASAAGANIYKAIARGIALMNFHTTLDVSKEAAGVLPGMLGLNAVDVLVPIEEGSLRGYGQVCAVNSSDKPFKLAHLAARCTSVFGRVPRVWGDFSRKLERIVVANGSANKLADLAARSRLDCLVCGELGYHAALDAAQAGLAIVELGHDVSELPLVAVLAQAVIELGLPPAYVSVIDQSANWTTPDSTRI